MSQKEGETCKTICYREVKNGLVSKQIPGDEGRLCKHCVTRYKWSMYSIPSELRPDRFVVTKPGLPRNKLLVFLDPYLVPDMANEIVSYLACHHSKCATLANKDNKSGLCCFCNDHRPKNIITYIDINGALCPAKRCANYCVYCQRRYTKKIKKANRTR